MNKYKQSINSTVHIPEFKGINSGGGDTLVEFHQSDIKYKVTVHSTEGGKTFYMVDKEFFPCSGSYNDGDLEIFYRQHTSDIKDNPLEPFSNFVMNEIVGGISWADGPMMIWATHVNKFFIVNQDDQQYYFPLAFLPYMEKFANYIGGSLESTEEVPPLAPDEEDVLLGYLLPVKTMDNMLNTLKQL